MILKKVQRFQCKLCRKKFSAATHKPTYRQKRRRINETIRLAFALCMYQSVIALLAGVNVKTVAERLVWQAELSREKNACFVEKYIGPTKKDRGFLCAPAKTVDAR